jgi:seryl-tRNA synthetase
MLDMKLIREQSDFIKNELEKVGFVREGIDTLLELDSQRRAKIHATESFKAQRSARSQEIRKITDTQERETAVVEMRELGVRISVLEKEAQVLEEEFQRRVLEIPNLPHPSVPVGRDDQENIVLRTIGALPEFPFSPKPHWEIGEQLGILDFERGVKISGSRFYILKASGARLQRALISWMLDLHVQQHGYTEIYPPAMVKRECLVGTGNLPKFGENLYHDHEEDFWWVPTAEVPVTNLYREEILEPGRLPIYHVAYSPCFLREKMSAGRDVRGIKRGHQFDKVEMVKFVIPDASDGELDALVDNAEDVCRKLEIPHRVIQMCTGDLSFTAAIKYDVEMWAPGCEEWLEVSSCSNFRDFQARRAQIRYRPVRGAKPEFVHRSEERRVGKEC